MIGGDDILLVHGQGGSLEQSDEMELLLGARIFSQKFLRFGETVVSDWLGGRGEMLVTVRVCSLCMTWWRR